MPTRAVRGQAPRFQRLDERAPHGVRSSGGPRLTERSDAAQYAHGGDVDCPVLNRERLNVAVHSGPGTTDRSVREPRRHLSVFDSHWVGMPTMSIWRSKPRVRLARWRARRLVSGRRGIKPVAQRRVPPHAHVVEDLCDLLGATRAADRRYRVNPLDLGHVGCGDLWFFLGPDITLRVPNVPVPHAPTMISMAGRSC